MVRFDMDGNFRVIALVIICISDTTANYIHRNSMRISPCSDAE